MTNHTPGPWAQGITLPTRETSRWTPEEIAENDARERRMVFSGFTQDDEGRGRRLVAVCSRVEDAHFIVGAPDLLEALLKLANAADQVGMAYFDTDDMPEEAEAMLTATLEARAAIAKAKGEAQ